jgi:MYXO-CTERM domain-containing protein
MVVVAALLAAPTWIAPRSVNACSIGDGIWSTEPDSGAALPTGSRLFLYGYFELVDVLVDVDGMPATLVLDPELPRTGSGAAYRIEPPPPEGANVTVYECYAEDPTQCELPEPPMTVLSWTVTAADTTTPEAARTLEFGIYDHADFVIDDSCTEGEISYDVTIYAHLELVTEDGPGAARQALIEVIDAEDGTVWATRLRPVAPAGGPIDLDISFEVGELPESLEGAVCMRVTALDLAGYLAEPLTVCEPLGVVVDADQSAVPGDEAPAEPDWDAFDEPDAEEEEASVDRGCACTAHPQALPGSLLFGLVGLGLRARRRRSRRPVG